MTISQGQIEEGIKFIFQQATNLTSAMNGTAVPKGYETSGPFNPLWVIPIAAGGAVCCAGLMYCMHKTPQERGNLSVSDYWIRRARGGMSGQVVKEEQKAGNAENQEEPTEINNNTTSLERGIQNPGDVEHITKLSEIIPDMNKVTEEGSHVQKLTRENEEAGMSL